MKKLSLLASSIAFLVLLFATLRLIENDQPGVLNIKGDENASHQQHQIMTDAPRPIDPNREQEEEAADPEDVSARHAIQAQAVPDSEKSPNIDLKRETLIRIAYERASEVMEIADSASAVIAFQKDEVIVTFPYTPGKDSKGVRYPGPDYVARVRLDARTGKVIEILGAQ